MFEPMTRLFFVFVVFVSILWAEPSRPECIAPAKPGGGFDLTCKLAQESMLEAKILSKPMKIFYLPGGVGVKVYDSMITRRSKDSNAIIAFSSGTLLNIATGKHGKYDENAVKWLASAGAEYGMFAVMADSPYKNLSDLVGALKQDPLALRIGTGGPVKGQDWLQIVLVAKAAGIDARKFHYVPFEGGGETLNALLDGRVEAVSAGISESLPHLRAGKIRVLAVFSENRLEGELANIPTAREQGYDVVWPVVRGYYMAPNVSQEDFQWWVDAFDRLKKTDAFKRQMRSKGLFELDQKSGDEFAKYIRGQMKKYRALVMEFDSMLQD